MSHAIIDKESLTWRVTPDLLAIIDAGGIFLEANPAWFDVLGRQPEEIQSRPFMEFVHPDDVPATEQAYADLQGGAPVLKFQNRYRHRNGSYRWLDWNAVPEGALYLCSARDVTEAKETTMELARQELEAKFRDQFVAVLGHDLRNPLAALDAVLMLLNKEPQSQRAREIIAAGQGSVTRMSELINNVTDFAQSRLGGGIAIDPQDGVAPEPLLQKLVEEIRLGGQTSAAIVEMYHCPQPIRCDPARLSQLVSNLVANALHHGKADAPVRINAFEQDDTFTLTVANDGTPIPESTRAMLFQPFTRAEVRSSQNGLGLGLYISHQIAKAHGGTLSFTSNDAETLFRFELPMAA